MSAAANARALDYALALSRRGLSVIPVPRAGEGHDGKRPAITWKPFQTRRPDESEIRAWFAMEQNVAIITGAVSSVVVVDTDSPEAEEWARLRLPRTPWRVKTAKGWHRYYRHPGSAVRNAARIETGQGRLALDVRGDGGFVIGPGSIHASGVIYTAHGDWSVPSSKLPVFWLGLLKKPSRPSPSPRPIQIAAPRDVVTRARAYLAAIPRPVIDQGSDNATFGAACRLTRGFMLAESDAVELLCEWAPDFDRWWIEQKTSDAVRYGSEAEGGLLGRTR